MIDDVDVGTEPGQTLNRRFFVAVKQRHRDVRRKGNYTGNANQAKERKKERVIKRSLGVFEYFHQNWKTMLTTGADVVVPHNIYYNRWLYNALFDTTHT